MAFQVRSILPIQQTLVRVPGKGLVQERFTLPGGPVGLRTSSGSLGMRRPPSLTSTRLGAIGAGRLTQLTPPTLTGMRMGAIGAARLTPISAPRLTVTSPRLFGVAPPITIGTTPPAAEVTAGGFLPALGVGALVILGLLFAK